MSLSLCRLSHIVHDAHDANFHAMWQQLRDEHEQLARKGYTGEGFLSAGRKLGGRHIPMDEARRRARAMAEKRRALNAGSGQRLGGAPVRRGTDIRRVIADAAQRRATVTQGCGSGTKDTNAIVEQATKNGFQTQAEEDDANERAIMEAYIELLQEEEKEKWGDAYVPPSNHNPNPGSVREKEAAKRKSPPKPGNSTSIPPPLKSPIPLPANNSTISSMWTCQICTLENPWTYLYCDACDAERPELIRRTSISVSASSDTNANANSQASQKKSSSNRMVTATTTRTAQPNLTAMSSSSPAYWLCQMCETVMESQWWTCSVCGTMKLSS